MPLAVRTLLFTLLFPGTVCVLLPGSLHWTLEPAARPTFDALGWTGAAFIAAGLAVYGRCVWDFGVHGRGTPAPYDPPRELVVSGLYRYSRNPMYLAIVAILLGESALFHSLALLPYAGLVAIGFHVRVVLYEEPTLRRMFGAAFDRYCASTARWLPLRGPRKRNGGGYSVRSRSRL